MESKELNIINTQRDIGWVYSDLKWLVEKEIKSANKKRDSIFNSISKKVNYSFTKNKIHIGQLSPGCLICGQGYWSCMFINGLCTAHCFYCPQDREIKKERPAIVESGIKFDKPEDYIAYLEKFNFRGVGFNGGETLLVFKRLVEYIRKIKERFGKDFYLWIYTNGDLVDKGKLLRFKRAGLDEIRFNISASAYDLRPVELAVNIIKTVTVEIPAILQDYEKVKRCLIKMQNIGVKHLNIHQLSTTQYNYKNFIERGYTFLHQPNIPIFESEIVALKLLRFALANKIDLAINYCSVKYKERIQDKGNRERIADFIKEDFEGITNSGYIRNLSIKDSAANMKKIIKLLQKRAQQSKLYSLNDTKTKIFIHGALLKDIDFSKHDVIISYFEPQIKTALHWDESGKEIVLNPDKKVFLKKDLVAQHKGLSPIAMQSYQKLFIENINEKEVLNYFYRNYNLRTKESLNEMKREIELLMALKTWEHLGTGLAEVY